MERKYKCTCHQTCRKTQDAHILFHSPFCSHIVKKITNKGEAYEKIPFLGIGYYFWEDNFEAGVEWGEKHYKEGYRVVEYLSMEIDTFLLLDVDTYPGHFFLFSLIEKWEPLVPDSLNWQINNWIEYFKKLRLELGFDIFPFNAIRAPRYSDDDHYASELSYLDKNKKYYIYKTKKVMICFFEREYILFETKNIVA